jgi:drug/metabolite transporter (DMT)-like permease
MILGLLSLAGVVVISAAAQLLMKHGAVALDLGGGARAFLSSLRPSLLLAAVAFFAAPPLYFFALTRLELSFAFFATALTQLAVAVGARLFFGERLRSTHLVAFFIIVTGLCLWNL